MIFLATAVTVIYIFSIEVNARLWTPYGFRHANAPPKSVILIKPLGKYSYKSNKENDMRYLIRAGEYSNSESDVSKSETDISSDSDTEENKSVSDDIDFSSDNTDSEDTNFDEDTSSEEFYARALPTLQKYYQAPAQYKRIQNTRMENQHSMV